MDEFTIARYLESSTFVHPETGVEQKFVNVGTIREELEKIEESIEPECIEFIQTLFYPDPLLRPSARAALNLPWLQQPDGVEGLG